MSARGMCQCFMIRYLEDLPSSPTSHFPGMNPQEGPLHAWHVFTWPGGCGLIPGHRVYSSLLLWFCGSWKRGHKNMDISWASTMCRHRAQACACIGSEQFLYHRGARSRKSGDKGSGLSTVLEPTKCLANGSFFVSLSYKWGNGDSKKQREGSSYEWRLGK